MTKQAKLKDLCKQIIRLRDGMVCQLTKQPVTVTPVGDRWPNTAEVAHVERKTKGNAVRYLLVNQILLSAAAHDRAHGDELAFHRWFQRVYPERWRAIQEVKDKIMRHWELDGMIGHYKGLLDELREGDDAT